MRPGRRAAPYNRAAARPNRLTAVYLQCKGRQFQRASGRRGPNRRRLASPIQHTPPVLVYLLATSRCLVWGRQSWGNSAGFCGPRLSPLFPVRLSSSGVWGCKIRAIYKTSATPSSGLVETPSGGCGKDGFFLRLSLNYRYNSAAVLLLVASWGVFPHLMDGSAPCCRWSYRRGPRTPL